MMNLDVYKSLPRGAIAGRDGSYPVFSDVDDYIENYDRISADHLSVYEKEGVNPFIAEEIWSESEEITNKLVRKWASVGSRVLDVGCGMGRLLTKLPEYERYGMDISAAYLKYATQSGAELCLSKIEDMPYQDGFFDLVVCTDVLEHVLDPHVAITQLFRVLKIGGYLVIRVPYREELQGYLHPDYPYQLAHLRNFDEFSLRMLFEKIFHGHLVDEALGPYILHPGYLKYPVRIRGTGFLLRNVLRVCALISPEFKKSVVTKIFKPVEISIVVRK